MTETLVIVVLGLIAAGAVAYPFLAGYARYPDQAALDADLQRYRDAVDAGTVCPRCTAAGRPETRFCAECGHALGDDED